MKKYFLTSVFLMIALLTVHAQLFTKITDAQNPIVNIPAATDYVGAAWVDYDNDGKLDLFVVRGGLFHNDGNGNFSNITTSGLPFSGGLGNTWADYDNDGDLDCFISAGTNVGSKLYTNNGNGTFTHNTSGPLASPLKLKAWSSAWGDYDDDGFVDLMLAAPVNFAGITDSNKLLRNNGNGTFTRIDTTPITCCEKPYTIGSWCDYDQDGDEDIFIGSGPANGTVAVDYMYKNQLKETGNAYFTNTIPSPVRTDKRDGQTWNWIDFDNDGDLDGYVTNYEGINANTGEKNDFYRNDNGSFTKLTVSDVGRIVGDSDISLANIWEDFDNDGDLDCIVINDGTLDNAYYQSNIMQGNSVFTRINNEPFVHAPNGQTFSVSAGDYDGDGDLDLYVVAASSARGLYRNDVSNGNKWINIHLRGVASNRSAIGAQVHVMASINGNIVWQMREVSAENSFNGMNELNTVFGLGNATVVDSVIIHWPSGLIDRCANIAVNQFYEAVEGNCLSPAASPSLSEPKGSLNVFPNPFSQECRVRVVMPQPGHCSLNVYDVMGNKIQTLADEEVSAGTHEFAFNAKNIAGGTYFLKLNSEDFFLMDKIVLVK